MNQNCDAIIAEIKQKIEQIAAEIRFDKNYEQAVNNTCNEILAIIQYVVESWKER